MLSSIIVGMIEIFILSDAGLIKLSHKPMNVGAILIGGALFGSGWAIMGFCPGTSVAALVKDGLTLFLQFWACSQELQFLLNSIHFFYLL
jgi:uncharacterized membrane protein YedE/YeeE